MQKLLIDGKKILSGTINISGSKNSTLPILAATILNNQTTIKNIPLVNENSIPEKLKKNSKMTCVIGLTTEAERLFDIRKNRMITLKETESTNYTDIQEINKEVENAKKTFLKYKWPTIDVTRKSVEEVAASVIKIHEIFKNNA